MLWLDRVEQTDKKYNFEAIIDKALAAEVEHPNSELFSKIFNLLDALREDKSIDSQDLDNEQKSKTNRSLLSERSTSKHTSRHQSTRSLAGQKHKQNEIHKVPFSPIKKSKSAVRGAMQKAFLDMIEKKRQEQVQDQADPKRKRLQKLKSHYVPSLAEKAPVGRARRKTVHSPDGQNLLMLKR